MFDMITLPQELPGGGIGAADAARLSMKSAGINPADPFGTNGVVAQVTKSLKDQGIEADADMVKALVGQAMKSGMVMKATDPEKTGRTREIERVKLP